MGSELMDACNVLISSAGRRVALLRLFRASLAAVGARGKVLATEISRLSSAYHEADESHLVPRCTSDEFVPFMLDFCQQHGVKLIVPTIDPELPVYAANRERFEAIGVTVNVSSAKTIEIARDKQLTHDWLVAHGFPYVRLGQVAEVLEDPSGWSFPLVVKPRRGSASIGVAKVGDVAQLRVAARGGDFVVQAMAKGIEYSVDCYVNREGRCVCAGPRKRLEVRGGEVSKSVTVDHPRLGELAGRMLEALPGAFGVINVQIFHDEATGESALIEFNARFGGGYPLTHEAGGTYAKWLIEEVCGLPRTASQAAWRPGVAMLRWDDAVFVSAEEAGLAEG